MSEYAVLGIGSPILDEQVEDRVYEQRRLRELNSRLRNLFEIEQANNNELNKGLQAIQLDVAGVQNDIKKMEKKYEDTLELLKKEKAQEAKMKEVIPTKSQPIIDEPAARNTYDQAEDAIDRMIRKKQEKFDALDRKLQELIASSAELTAQRDAIQHQVEKEAQELEQLLAKTAALDVECSKYQTLLDRANQDREFLLAKINNYGNEGVEPYYEKSFGNHVETGDAELEAKYKAFHDEQIAALTQDSARKLEEARKNQLSILEQKKQLEQECSALTAAIEAARKEISELQHGIQQAQIRLAQLQEEIADKEKEIQAALGMKKVTLREIDALKDEIAQSNHKTKQLEEQNNKSQRELHDLLYDKSEKERAVGKELAKLKEELDRLAQQLEGANIFVGPEIDKYRGLVEIAEVNFTTPPRKKTRVAN